MLAASQRHCWMEELRIDLPASSVVGPADEECIGAYGDTLLVQAAVSYGVQPIALSANLLPPTGNPTIYVYRLRLFAEPGGSADGLIGGVPVNVTTLGNSAPS